LFEALPGVPVPDAGDASLEGRRFPAMAERMGHLISDVHRLTPPEADLPSHWAEPAHRAAHAEAWVGAIGELDRGERDAAKGLVRDFPALFADRQAVLAHGDFAPVNVLTDGKEVTGLLDLEDVCLADPLLDVAWWAWSVGSGSGRALTPGWRSFLDGAGIEADADIEARVSTIQAVRMLELLASGALGESIRSGVIERLRTALA
jgi:aminoglycoside phosphotransferase (APT) family kinase protein